MIAVVGAGIGGLSAAIELAFAGHEVHVFDQQPEVGGKAAAVREAGFTFDPGPSIVILPRVYEALLSKVGETPADWLRFKRLDPITRLIFEGSEPVDLPSDEGKLFALADDLFPGDAEEVRRLVDGIRPLAPLGEEIFFERTVQSPWQLLNPKMLAFGKTLDVRHSFKEQVDARFKSPVLRALFYGFPSYSGLTYRSKSAAPWFIPYYMIAEGVYFPEGGIHRIPGVLEAVAKKLGVVFHLNTKVRAFTRERNRIIGLDAEGASGQRFDAVVAAVDRLTIGEMLGRTETRAPSLSYSTVQLGLRLPKSGLPCHTLLIDKDFDEGYSSLYETETAANWKVTYVNAPDGEDASLSPEGCSQLFLVASSPADNGKVDWKAETSSWRERLKPKLACLGIEFDDGDILVERTQTPPDFEARDGNYRGSLFGLREEHRSMFGLPMNNRDPEFKNLFYCGASVQPGAGMPMACLSGSAAARLLTQYLRRRPTRLF